MWVLQKINEVAILFFVNRSEQEASVGTKPVRYLTDYLHKLIG